jgi:magnesium chelatase subunit H
MSASAAAAVPLGRGVGGGALTPATRRLRRCCVQTNNATTTTTSASRYPAAPTPTPTPGRRPSRRGAAASQTRRHALSEPPESAESAAVDTDDSLTSNAEKFVREELARNGLDPDAPAAMESPEEVVAALEDEVARLTARKVSLTEDLNTTYNQTFGRLTVDIPIASPTTTTADGTPGGPEPETLETEPRSYPDIDEAGFRRLGGEEPGVMAALITGAQEGDAAQWLAFQREAHRAKLQRDRVETELAAAAAELNIARRGGGAVAAAAAAMHAAEAVAAAAAARGADGVVEAVPPAPRRIVLISGFESFNVKLYRKAAKSLAKRCPWVELVVFSDRDIDANREEVAAALEGADVFFGSLLFDFDQVEWLQAAVAKIPTRFVFESALELMSTTSVGSFEMKPSPDGAKAGPPPAVKAILAKFGSGKEEDKLVGYLSFLKIGPALLRFVPGRKAKDLRNWLTVYGYWNQGGRQNVEEAFVYVAQQYLAEPPTAAAAQGTKQQEGQGFLGGLMGAAAGAGGGSSAATVIKPMIETPALGVYHPEIERAGLPWPTTVKGYLDWYETERVGKGLVPSLPVDAPVVAVLLYRKHVITQQPYLADLVHALEESGVKPVPIFINGVEAHTVVRDLLTTEHEQARRAAGILEIDSLSPNAAVVDAVVSTVGFPLVGGPAGSMEAGRQAEVAQGILSAKNVPYIVAAPLLVQDIASWQKSGIGGLQSVILYALPELDGAIDTVPLGGLVGDDIYLTRERVYALANRLTKWVSLRRKKAAERTVAVMLYGFPPGVGATGTAALLNVPRSLEAMLQTLKIEGYDLGPGPLPSGEALVDALRALEEGQVIAGGVAAAETALERLKAKPATAAAAAAAAAEEEEVVETEVGESVEGGESARESAGESAAGEAAGSGLEGVSIAGADVSPAQLKRWLEFPRDWGPTEWGPMPFLPNHDALVRNMEAAWGPLESYAGLATVPGKGSFVAGLKVGNVFIGVQPALGVEGDPMRLLFERDLTPHPQYAAYYKWLQNGLKADAVLHMGMHGTVEWLPGSPLGNTGLSWSDQLLGAMPNVYVYAANNPSESIVAKRRGYGTIVSHNVPPYGRAGLYRQTAELRELLSDYREDPETTGSALRGPIFDLVASAGLDADCPYVDPSTGEARRVTSEDLEAGEVTVSAEAFQDYASELYAYLGLLENRLFSEGLHTLGGEPTEASAAQYLSAYFGEKLSEEAVAAVAGMKATESLDDVRAALERSLALPSTSTSTSTSSSFSPLVEGGKAGASSGGGEAGASSGGGGGGDADALAEAVEIRSLLRRNVEELTGAVKALNGEYLLPAVGGDLLRDGPGVLPTGRNIHALDPYRMPSPAAAERGARVARAILDQHRAANDGAYPETVSVNLWGLDAIKTKGESVGIVLELVGARSVKEGTGRVVRYELIPLAELGGRPRVDVLCNMSGIFRDSFANVVGLLDDLFQRAAEAAEEDPGLNFIRKHALEMRAEGIDNAGARLFSNPPGDYGSMVNERVGTGEWEDGRELGDTWASRNAYSYGKGDERGAARPEVLQALLRTTERVVQEVDSVEYGLTDIQEYYANTGALVAAANAAKEDTGTDDAGANADSSNKTKKSFKPVACSIVETFGEDVTPRDLDETLRLEYRTKLLNPRWAEAMADQGSGGAYEISQRMTALVGWGATAGFTEDWVYDGAHERYVEDEAMREKLRRANPQAFRNVLRRMLEAAGRGMWNADEQTLAQLRLLYQETEDELEGVKTRP